MSTETPSAPRKRTPTKPASVRKAPAKPRTGKAGVKPVTRWHRFWAHPQTRDWIIEARGGITLGAWGLALLLLSGFATRFVPPFDVVRSLWPHLGIVALLAGVAVLLVGGRIRALPVFFAAGLALLVPLYAVTLGALPLAPQTGEGMRVMTVNALAWNRESRRLADHLVEAPYDIVAVQEAPGLGDHLAMLRRAYPYSEGCETPQTCDLLLLSRRPLRDAQHTPFPLQGNRLISASVEMDGRELTVVATHLTKPHHDFTQAQEVVKIMGLFGQLGPDTVLMGDLNSAPWSGVLDWLEQRTGLDGPRGYRPTWPVDLGPLGVPIDHILMRGGVRASAIDVRDDPMGSNHRSVTARLTWAD